jgi:hypothetical protein
LLIDSLDVFKYHKKNEEEAAFPGIRFHDLPIDTNDKKVHRDAVIAPVVGQIVKDSTNGKKHKPTGEIVFPGIRHHIVPCSEIEHTEETSVFPGVRQHIVPSDSDRLPTRTAKPKDEMHLFDTKTEPKRKKVLDLGRIFFFLFFFHGFFSSSFART